MISGNKYNHKLKELKEQDEDSESESIGKVQEYHLFLENEHTSAIRLNPNSDK